MFLETLLKFCSNIFCQSYGAFIAEEKMLAINRGGRVKPFQTQAFYNYLTHGKDC